MRRSPNPATGPHALLLASTVLLASTLAFPGAAAAQQPGEVVVEGNGEVRVPPDRATLLFSIETRAAEAQPAARDNSRIQERVLDALEDAGAPRDALSTLSYGVQPEWEWHEGERSLIGYVAHTTIRVRTGDLDAVGALVDAALDAGVNRVDQVRFELADPEAARREALAVAVRNARAAAEAMAAAAGGTLGRLVVLTTQDDAAPSPVPRAERAMAMAAPAGEDTQVVPGEQTIRASVVGRWEFVPGER